MRACRVGSDDEASGDSRAGGDGKRMTLKEIVGNEEMQVLLTRGQEQGFLGIEEVAEALQVNAAGQ